MTIYPKMEDDKKDYNELKDSVSFSPSIKDSIVCLARDPRQYATFVAMVMMSSSNGTIFRVIGPLWGESTGHWWIPITKASDAELWCFLWFASNKLLAKQSGRRHRAHHDVSTMGPVYWALFRQESQIPQFWRGTFFSKITYHAPTSIERLFVSLLTNYQYYESVWQYFSYWNSWRSLYIVSI